MIGAIIQVLGAVMIVLALLFCFGGIVSMRVRYWPGIILASTLICSMGLIIAASGAALPGLA